MAPTNDIMIHGIPNVLDANERLRYELDCYQNMFGPIRWLRIATGPPQDATTYGFLRYIDTTIHPTVVDHLNRRGIPNTRIWFEINQVPTTIHRLLQAAPASKRVQRQLETLEQKEHEFEEERVRLQTLVESTQAENRRLADQVRDLQRLNNELLTQSHTQVDRLRDEVAALQIRNSELEQLAAIDPPQMVATPTPVVRTSRWVPLSFRVQADSRGAPSRPPLRQLPKPSTEPNTRLVEGKCAICFGQLADAKALASTECGHVFCEVCLYLFLRAIDRNRDRGDYRVSPTNFDCPSCRTPLGPRYYTKLKF